MLPSSYLFGITCSPACRFAERDPIFPRGTVLSCAERPALSFLPKLPTLSLVERHLKLRAASLS
jgi:hypothetical protein